MANNTREIRRRIKSVKNTKKITKAMELVSAAKMRKAVNRVLMTRSYANVAWEILLRLSDQVDKNMSPLLRIPKAGSIKKIAVIVVASNRGLCGGFNTNVVQKAVKFIKEKNSAIDCIDVITIGKKSYSGLVRYKFSMKADFDKKDVITSITDIYPMSHFVLDSYIKGEYDQIMIVYTDFESALRQIPRVTQLLPLSLIDIDQELGSVDQKSKNEEFIQKDLEYLLEPSPEKLIEYIAPKIIEIKLYQAVLESEASEHSSRMLAMKNASEAADDMVSSLVSVYNRARQASITQEISEISAGKASLE